MVWVIAFGELFFGDLWCVVWGYGGMRTHFSLLNPFRKMLHVRGRGHGGILECSMHYARKACARPGRGTRHMRTSSEKPAPYLVAGLEPCYCS